MRKENFYVLTGGPGAGKTTVLEALRDKGFACVDEVGRKIIQEQKAIGGNIHHNGDRLAYRDLMLARSIADFERMIDEAAPVFFDRGIPGLIGYCRLIGVDVPLHLKEAVAHYRYSSTVFLFPPWPEIYENDADRKQDFQEAINTYSNIKEAYAEYGYRCVEMPKASVAARVDFILSQVLAA
ncbi:MAG TPA: AAA family ATPase [Rhizomicrobium sp.]